MKEPRVDYVLPPPPRASLAIQGAQQRFPIRRIFCVGRNYAAHAREMGRDPTREPPFFFTKPADAAFDGIGEIPYPPETNNLHYEMELVVAIGLDGFAIPIERARDHIWGYGVGLDMTRRDLQLAARDLGRPWDWGKAFDKSAPIASLRPASEIGHPEAGRIWLEVNGELRQNADIGDLIWSVPEVVSILSQSMRLKAGDLIMTGTPAGVGPVNVGDRLEGGVAGVGELRMRIGPSER